LKFIKEKNKMNKEIYIFYCLRKEIDKVSVEILMNGFDSSHVIEYTYKNGKMMNIDKKYQCLMKKKLTQLSILYLCKL